MKKAIKFTKMHGAGNDYIYVNTLLYNIKDPAKASIEWSKPHFGIGSDGLILIGKATEPGADFSMRIFNNDGSEAMMCGNGTRCVAKYLSDKHMTDNNPIRLQTLSGIKILHLHYGKDQKVDQVTVDMGEPSDIHDMELTVCLDGTERTFKGTAASMGNPHFVIFLDEDVEKFPLEKYGPLLEHHEAFPNGCNIEFANTTSDGNVRMRVWERGSGITLACGTGACATAVATKVTGRGDNNTNIKMDGGTLNIKWDENNHIMMTGPAAIAFEGEITLDEE